jgi:hypothetical protein
LAKKRRESYFGHHASMSLSCAALALACTLAGCSAGKTGRSGLTGDVKGTQNKTYFDVPFTVPAGVHRVSVDFHYTVVHLLLDGEDTNTPLPLYGVNSTVRTTASPSAGRHYLRLEVRDRAGVSELITSPLYINFPEE